MIDGDQLKMWGMELVETDEDQRWRDLADWAITCLAREGKPFTAEDVCRIAGRPAHPNAVGARISAHARRGDIVRHGFAKAIRPDRHANVMAVWIGA